MVDLPGKAMMDYYEDCAAALLVCYADGTKEEMPLSVYFRDEDEMPGLELVALQECYGKVLDVGAGAGAHALALQAKGFDVVALDISPLAVELMRLRGLKKVLQTDVFSLHDGAFDTILMLMNGIGLAGDLDGFRRLLRHLGSLLLPGGQLVFDTSDVAYLYQGKPPTDLEGYYGEIRCRYEYEDWETDWFTWLYLDLRTLEHICQEEGWDMDLLLDDGDDHFLVRARKLGQR